MKHPFDIETTREPSDIVERELLNHCVTHKTSFLAAKLLEEDYQLVVCRSGGGFYLGCSDLETGEPVSRDSQYFPTAEAAQEALDDRSWTQRMNP